MTRRNKAGETVLRLDGISKRFGTFLANDNISLVVRAGEVVALLGENGAGKTTLMNILFGHYVADAGHVEVFGKPLPPGNPRAALTAGVGMVHQHFTLADNLTVAENIGLGTESLWSAGTGKVAVRARIQTIARDFGLAIHPDATVGSLSVGERQRVEILKALYRRARVLILDEPTAVLTPQESEALFATLRRATEQGLAVVLISHKLHEVMGIADRAVVLRHGRVVAETAIAETDRARLAAAMVGGEVPLPKAVLRAPGMVLMRLERVTVPVQGAAPGLQGIDLDICAGQIVGLAGVSGNGQSAIADLISGLVRPSGGTLWLKGVSVRGWSPRHALANGIARIPEDRHRTGTVADFTLAENAVLEAYSRAPFSRGGWMNWPAAESFARDIIGKYDVRCPGPDQRIRLLSGGNMQKLILGRVLEARPEIILANQPVRGLDVGAIAYVHSQLIAARDAGAAVMLISEDLDEIMALSDVIHVISQGRLSPAFARGSKTQAELGLWMAGQGFGGGADAA